MVQTRISMTAGHGELALRRSPFTNVLAQSPAWPRSSGRIKPHVTFSIAALGLIIRSLPATRPALFSRRFGVDPMSSARTTVTAAHAQPPFFAGVDLGGTNIKIGLVDDQGRTLAFVSIPTEIERGAEDGTRRMGESVRRVIAEAGLKPSDIARVGLGTPGTMDVPNGMLLEPVNLPTWRNFPIRDRLAHHAGLPVTYANDAKAAAFGEVWVGAGRGLSSMVLFTLGTGIGCGIIVDGLLVVGEHSHGAECGHIIDRLSRRCPNVRLRQDGPFGSLCQRDGRHQSGRARRSTPAAKVRYPRD